MKDKLFYVLITTIIILGVVFTGLLVKYTVDLSENASITSYISNEE